MQELVSIITASYKCEKYIGDTIRSVLRQTYDAWEMIIVDDCSGDNTQAVVEAFADPRIIYHKLEKNCGAAVARTTAMQMAKGEYMAFLDSDDLWLPDKLSRQIAFMKGNNCAFSCTAYEQVDDQGKSLGKVIHTKRRTNYNGLLLTCPVGNSTVMYDVRKMGKFTVPDIRKRNDDALWLQMLKKEQYIFGLDEVLAQYRIRPASITTSSSKMTLVKYHWKLYREIEHLSIPRSAFHVCVWGLLKTFRIK